MLPLIPLLLLLHLHISPISTLHPIHPCSPSPSITFRGSNDVTRAGGPALIVFAPLQCANCYNYLRSAFSLFPDSNDLAASRSYRISVVAPDFESNHIIQRTKTAFPNLQIDRAGEGWPRLGAKNFDAMVLDACSRVTDTFQWPQSDVTTSSAIQTALDSTSIKCGGGVQKCQVVTSSGSHSKKRVNAWIKEQQEAAEQLRRRSQNPQNPQNPQNLQYHYQNPQNLQNLHIPSNPHQQAYYPQNHQNQNPSHLQNSQNHQNPQNPQNLNSNSYQNHNSYNNGYQSLYTPPPPPVPPQVVPTEKATTTTTTDPSSDYDYYPESDSLPITTQSTQTQIPRPPSSSPYGNTWPTYSPFFQHPQNQWNAQYPYQQQNPYQKSGPPPPNMMDANLPCSAFTDDICHQQREQMGALVSKCCNKGIYLTDVCIPGKCSNSTTQLCCFQKFLQAKYSCCNDPTQDEGAPKMTNKFNKCCHNLFVTDDPCCPESAARRYWSTAYEVCMPTVTVDFSPVRFEVHFTEGVRVLDLSVDRQWEFNCTYGVKQPQFAYLPSDHIVVADFIRGL